MRLTGYAILLLLTSCISGKQPQEKAGDQPMNVLFISLDDMNDWIRLLDSNAPIETPNLERLAGKGMLFTQAYCASPSCNPSRTAVLTGKMPPTSVVSHNATDWKHAKHGEITPPHYFKPKGHRTKDSGNNSTHTLNSTLPT